MSCFHTGTSFYSPKLAIEYLLNLFGMFERLGFDTWFVSGLEVAIATAAVLRESIAEDEVSSRVLFRCVIGAVSDTLGCAVCCYRLATTVVEVLFNGRG